jgi:hypothetical protein
VNLKIREAQMQKVPYMLVVGGREAEAGQVAVRHRKLDQLDFESGGLNQPSRIRPNRLFTADCSIVLYAAGRLRDGKVEQAANAVIAILS